MNERSSPPTSEIPPASAPSPAAPTRRAPAFVFVFITVLLDMLALGMIIPVLPRLGPRAMAVD